MAIDLYYMLESPPCRTVLMVAKHLGISLNLIKVDLSKQEHLKPEFVKMNPQHKVPTIVDNGYVLWESRAIITYLVNQYFPNSPLYPTDPQKRGTIERLLQFDIGTLDHRLLDYLGPLFAGKAADEEKHPKFKDTLTVLDEILGTSKFVSGNEVSLADISIIASLSFAESADYDFSEWKNVSNWLASIKKELPYYESVNKEAINNCRDYINLMKNKTQNK